MSDHSDSPPLPDGGPSEAVVAYVFGPFRLEADERRLLRDGEPVDLTPKALDTLLVLIREAGHLVSKDDLLERVWPDTVVEENYLSVNVSKVRTALGETARDWHYIETVTGHGYRFQGEVLVERYPQVEPHVIVARRTRTRLLMEEVDEAEPSPPSGLLPSRPRPAWHWITAGCLVLVLLAGLWRLERPAPATTMGEVRSLAVLPLRPLHGVTPEGSAEEGLLGLGLADAMITKLTRLNGLAVRPTSAIARYDAPETDPLAAGRALGVHAVLDGRVQQTADRLRVTVQLVDVQAGSPLWSETFDAPLTDVFAVQDTIAAQVARALALALSTEERARLNERYTDNPDAYMAYVRGRYFWNKRTEEGLRRSLDYYGEALDHDPAYAQAYAGLADTYAMLGSYGGLLPADAYPKAKAAAEKALALEPDLAEAYVPLALAETDYFWDWEAAEDHFLHALALNPQYATAHHQYATEYLSVMGRHDEAVRVGRQAVALDPLSLIINADMGRIYDAGGRPDEAIVQLEKTLEMDPAFALTRLYLSSAYVQKHQYDEAIAILEPLRAAPTDSLGPSPSTLAFLGYAYARAAREAQARKVIAELDTLNWYRYVAPIWQAIVYANLHEYDQAFALLDSAYTDRNRQLAYLNAMPFFRVLRDDPRAESLLARMGMR